MSHYSRRTVVRGAAWSVPVIAIAAPIPAFAASYPPVKITGYTEAAKCPGQSAGGNSNEFTYIFTFTATSPNVTPDMFTVAGSTVTVNGTVFPVKEIKTASDGNGGTIIYVITVPGTNSADGTGTLSFTYQSGDPVQTVTAGPFPYDGTHPNQSLCRNI
jgi:hypothetical protein